jgi:hypothetical protein
MWQIVVTAALEWPCSLLIVVTGVPALPASVHLHPVMTGCTPSA